jgi:hypothetical protein
VPLVPGSNGMLALKYRYGDRLLIGAGHHTDPPSQGSTSAVSSTGAAPAGTASQPTTQCFHLNDHSIIDQYEILINMKYIRLVSLIIYEILIHIDQYEKTGLSQSRGPRLVTSQAGGTPPGCRQAPLLPALY